MRSKYILLQQNVNTLLSWGQMSVKFVGLSKIIRDFLREDPISRGIVVERRAHLIRALLRIRYLTRETLIRQVEFQMGFAVFGKENWINVFHSDMRVVKKAFSQSGYHLRYSRKNGQSGYYFVNEPDALGESVKREIAGAIRELDDAQIEIYRMLPPSQKFYQAASIINLSKTVRQINDLKK